MIDTEKKLTAMFDIAKALVKSQDYRNVPDVAWKIAKKYYPEGDAVFESTVRSFGYDLYNTLQMGVILSREIDIYNLEREGCKK